MNLDAGQRAELLAALGTGGAGETLTALERCLRRYGGPAPSRRRYWTAARRARWNAAWNQAGEPGWRIKHTPWKKRGRPEGPGQSSRLAGAVACTLHDRGYRLTAEKDDVLASVLRVLFQACELNVADMRDVAALALDTLRNILSEQRARFNAWLMPAFGPVRVGGEVDDLSSLPPYRHASLRAAVAALHNSCALEAYFVLLRAFYQVFDRSISPDQLERAVASACAQRVARKRSQPVRLRPLPQ